MYKILIAVYYNGESDVVEYDGVAYESMTDAVKAMEDAKKIFFNHNFYIEGEN